MGGVRLRPTDSQTLPFLPACLVFVCRFARRVSLPFADSQVTFVVPVSAYLYNVPTCLYACLFTCRVLVLDDDFLSLLIFAGRVFPGRISNRRLFFLYFLCACVRGNFGMLLTSLCACCRFTAPGLYLCGSLIYDTI